MQRTGAMSLYVAAYLLELAVLIFFPPPPARTPAGSRTLTTNTRRRRKASKAREDLNRPLPRRASSSLRRSPRR